MNARLSFFLFLLFASCTAPRYHYNFGQPDATLNRPTERPEYPEVLIDQAPELSAAVAAAPPATVSRAPVGKSKVQKKLPASTPAVQRNVPDEPAVSNDMPADLKRSVIFLAAGAIALIIGGQVFWVAGSLSLLIGLIFGIKWLLRK